MKIKKVMALALTGVLSFSMLTACGSKTDSANKESGDEKVTIRLLTRMAGTSTQVGIYNDIINNLKVNTQK